MWLSVLFLSRFYFKLPGVFAGENLVVELVNVFSYDVCEMNSQTKGTLIGRGSGI